MPLIPRDSVSSNRMFQEILQRLLRAAEHGPIVRWKQRVEFAVEQDCQSSDRLLHRRAGSLEVSGVGHPQRLGVPNVNGFANEKTPLARLVEKRGYAAEIGIGDLDYAKSVKQKVAV